VSLVDKPWPGQPPYGEHIPGHEYSGTVAAAGETVDEFSVGDRVAVEAHLGCFRCKNCRVGNYTACLNYGNRKKGHRANGGFAQYVINHINTVHRIPGNISFEEAVLITNLGCVLYGFEIVGGYIVGELRAVSLWELGRIDLKPLVTHRFPLSRIGEAFETFVKRKGE
jgi:L-iditol 2-dehydrogenase